MGSYASSGVMLASPKNWDSTGPDRATRKLWKPPAAHSQAGASGGRRGCAQFASSCLCARWAKGMRLVCLALQFSAPAYWAAAACAMAKVLGSETGWCGGLATGMSNAAGQGAVMLAPHRSPLPGRGMPAQFRSSTELAVVWISVVSCTPQPARQATFG